MRVAPTNDRRASSSPDRISSGIPPACLTASSSCSRLGALRIAAVATATICSAPTSRATFACVATTPAVSVILSVGIEPVDARLFPMRVKARWVTSSRSWPLPASATSSLVVLLPMSIQAQIKRVDGGASSGMRGVLELPEQTGDDEDGLLADVHGIVADPLDAASDQRHVHCPFARIGVVPDLQREVKHVAVETIDLVVLAHQVLRKVHVAALERLLALDHLLARLLAHLLDVGQEARIRRRLVPRERDELRHVHALVAHALDVLHDVEQGGDQPQVPRHGRLQRQQRQHALVDLEVAAVDAVVVRDDHARQLDVLLLDGLERAVERLDHHVEAAERLHLELRELVLEVAACGIRHAGPLTRPCR